ncbi:hypothetical protein PHYPSEUDO_012348 [Phytophthora pseudosyringae]|uniref:Uncharacterized protein n=1 Tax=Phytophthora pseudosyringae TaxID=221518 RepID=A0A8T1V9K8_9STRA|nr:hypothetical protein PHYPSEUDO_012348 [Phytophthora pseudosyringae]
MEKHDRNEDAAVVGQASPLVKAVKSTLTCEYCNTKFTTRGMPFHRSKCARKRENEKAAAKKTRAYKFCILNESIHEEILIFLGNQTLMKMQMITGDRYQQCESVLARYCCKCENDNLVVKEGFCHVLQATKHEAKDKYGVRDKDFSVFFSQPHAQYTLFDRVTLEKFMIRSCGSKMEWVRHLAKRDIRKKTAHATRIQNAEVYALLSTRAPAFVDYVRATNIKKMDKEYLEQCSQRFFTLNSEL